MQTSDISAWVNRICFWQSKWPFITQLSGEFIKSLRNLKTHLWSEALFIDRFGFWKICPRDGKLYQEKLWRNLSALSEKAMAPHSSTLAWKIPWMEEPGRLQSMRSLRISHDWATPLSLFTFMRWRRKWQPTPVFLPGESPGRGSLVGCRLWGRTESATTEAT